MNNSETDVLSLFGEEREGDEEMSDHTPRTEQTGDTCGAFDAGEQENVLREKAFRALMEGEYKDLFTAYFQETFNRRFKEYKQIKSELESSRDVLCALHERFGDLSGEALLNAIRAETGLKNAPAEAKMSIPEAAPATFEKEIAEACVEAERRLLSHIRARGMRPAENAVQTQSIHTAGSTRMTREERAEVARRAASGERIVL